MLQHLRGRFYEVPLHVRTRERGVGGLRQRLVQDVPELVEEGRQLGGGEQRGPAGTGLGAATKSPLPGTEVGSAIPGSDPSHPAKVHVRPKTIRVAHVLRAFI